MPSPKEIIKRYLDNRAKTDPQFAASYAKPKKSIDECFAYILNEARQKGTSVCMTDEEVFGLAVHYYDEDNIKVTTPPRAKVSTSKSKTSKSCSKQSEEKTPQKSSGDVPKAISETTVKKKKTSPAKKASKSSAPEQKQPTLFDFLDQ